MQLAGVLSGVLEVIAGEDVEVVGQGDAEMVGEGLDPPVLAGLQVDERESEGFLGSEGVSEAEVGPSELAKGEIARVEMN